MFLQNNIHYFSIKIKIIILLKEKSFLLTQISI